ncbi:hypothetical protein Tco_0501738 [Tanacetum coccineum]
MNKVGSIEPFENPLDTRKLESSSYHALGACFETINAFLSTVNLRQDVGSKSICIRNEQSYSFQIPEQLCQSTLLKSISFLLSISFRHIDEDLYANDIDLFRPLTSSPFKLIEVLPALIQSYANSAMLSLMFFGSVRLRRKPKDVKELDDGFRALMM